MLKQKWLAIVWLVLASAWLPLTALGQLERIVGQPDELQISADSIQHDRDTGQAVAAARLKSSMATDVDGRRGQRQPGHK